MNKIDVIKNLYNKNKIMWKIKNIIFMSNLPFHYHELNIDIQHDSETINKLYDLHNLIVLRPYNNEEIAIVGCGNRLYNYTKDDYYIIKHTHKDIYTIDIDITKNPSVVCAFPYQKLSHIPDKSFNCIIYECLPIQHEKEHNDSLPEINRLLKDFDTLEDFDHEKEKSKLDNNSYCVIIVKHLGKLYCNIFQNDLLNTCKFISFSEFKTYQFNMIRYSIDHHWRNIKYKCVINNKFLLVKRFSMIHNLKSALLKYEEYIKLELQDPDTDHYLLQEIEDTLDILNINGMYKNEDFVEMVKKVYNDFNINILPYIKKCDYFSYK